MNLRKKQSPVFEKNLFGISLRSQDNFSQFEMANGRKIFLKWGLTDKQKFIFVRFSLCFCLPIFAEVGAKLLELNNLTEFPGFQRRGFETENFTWWDTWSNASTPTSELQSDKIWLKLWSPAVIMSAADLTNGTFYRQKFLVLINSWTRMSVFVTFIKNVHLQLILEIRLLRDYTQRDATE